MGPLIISAFLWGFVCVFVYFRKVGKFQAIYFVDNPRKNQQVFSGLDASPEAFLALLAAARIKNKNHQSFIYARQAVKWFIFELISLLIVGIGLIFYS